MAALSGLRRSLESARTGVTAEVGPPRGADPEAVRRKVEPLRGWLDAVNIPDGQSAHARMSSWAGSLLVLTAGGGTGRRGTPPARNPVPAPAHPTPAPPPRRPPRCPG